jgi:hypothetical protein
MKRKPFSESEDKQRSTGRSRMPLCYDSRSRKLRLFFSAVAGNWGHPLKVTYLQT